MQTWGFNTTASISRTGQSLDLRSSGILRDVKTQKSRDLIYVAEEAWNQTGQSV